MKVLITNANSRMALCMTRRLAREGNRIIVGDYMAKPLASFSRYAWKNARYPSPYSAPEKFLETIADIIRAEHIDVILPIHEETFLFAKNKSLLQTNVKCCLPDYEAILKVHNKEFLHDYLVALNIDTPRTMRLSQSRGEDHIRAEMPGKLLLKPRQGGGNWGIFYLDQNRSYERQIHEYLSIHGIASDRVLLQQWIPGNHKYSHVVIYNKGRLVQDFADLHLRDFPLAGGAGCLRQTCQPDQFTNISKTLFDSLHWHGIAEVEYITHAESGVPYLIEVNPRIWGGVNSAIAAGLDIPGILLRIAAGENVESSSYALGIKTKWFWGDLRVLPQYVKTSASRLQAIADYGRSFVDGTKTDEFYWDDPLPFFAWPVHVLFKAVRNRSLEPTAYDSLSGEWI